MFVEMPSSLLWLRRSPLALVNVTAVGPELSMLFLGCTALSAVNPQTAVNGLLKRLNLRLLLSCSVLILRVDVVARGSIK